MAELPDVSMYFRGSRLAPGWDFTSNRTLMKAVILEWFVRHPGPCGLTEARDGTNCGNYDLFNSLIAELCRVKLMRLVGSALFPIVPLYSHAMVSVDGWLKSAKREQEANDAG